MKEVLRIDCPAVESLPYKALDNIEICDIPIPKGAYISLNIIGRHNNSKEWIDPLNFLPERFDPESKYFTVSNKTTESRDLISYSPFSIGNRKCPGQALALLEGKVILSYLLFHIECEIPEPLIKDDNVRFCVGSHFKLNIKIKKI